MSLMKEMLNAGVHFGHKKSFWNPKMKKYIFSINHGMHIINLEKTVVLFQKAIKFIRNTIESNGKILFIGTKKQARSIIEKEAQRCGMPYVSYRWLGGMLTNYKTVKESIKRLTKLKQMKENGFLESLTKKEILQHIRTIEKLEKFFGGIKEMGGLPDVIIVIDSSREYIAIKEAKKLNIKIISIVDTNSNPQGIDYVIPGNDDGIKCISFYMEKFANTIIDSYGLDKIIEVKDNKTI